ncbi:MAG: ADP-forming succinate--CoA ligase subunit beta [Sulfobacillus sp.]
MRLYEYLAKAALREAKIPVPEGRLATTVDEVVAAVEAIGPSAVKAQVLVGGRGKAGGIRFAETRQEAETVGRAILGMDLKGYLVERVYVEQKLAVEAEYYLSVTVDRSARKPLIMASAKGGIEIEDVAEGDLVRRHVDLSFGLPTYLCREIAAEMGLVGDEAKQVAAIIGRLYEVFRSTDAELVEINPLVRCGGRIIAADARLNIDDSALFRQGDLPAVEEGTALEKKVHAIGLAYVELDGDVAIMANGAGMSMATLDAVQHFGGAPANFLDAGGGASVEPTAQAIEVLLEMKPKVILINIFGGITRCDDVAKAITQVKTSRGIPVPLVVRLAGTNEQAGIEILQAQGIQAYRDMDQAAREAVRLSQGGA